MKPAPFKYLLADSLEQALAVKARYGDEAVFLAGGQSLIPTMNFRLAQPGLLVDLNGLTALDYVRESGDGGLRIGALVRHRRLVHDPLVARHQPLVREAASHVAHPQIRNRGTLCGNLAHADPASELPAVMLALNARLRAQSTRGERWIGVRDFFVSVFTTALQDDEMLVEVELPALPAGTGTCFVEVARRRGDYATIGVAAVVTLGDDGTCTHARLTYCSAGETPVSAEGAAGSLLGQRVSAQRVRDAGALARDEIDPPGGVQAGKDYQRQLVDGLTRRALATALARAGSEEKG